MKTINNITVNDSTLRSLQLLLQKKDSTLEELASEMLERGVKDTIYRQKRNAQKWMETKLLKERMEELESKLAHLNTLEEIGRGREDEIEEKE